jgi:UDP-glucose 4-epimerase
MKRCAIIGAKGYIGKHLEWYLLNKYNIQATCYDIGNEQKENYHSLDMTDKKSVLAMNLDVDYLFFIAGLTGTYAGFDDYSKYVSVNEIGLLNVLDAIKNSNFRPKIIFPSTRLVYKGADKPLKEEDEKEPRTIYAINKLACESILFSYKENFDIPYTVFRICVPYGNLFNNDYSFGTIGFFVKKAMSGQDIPLYGGGEMKRTFTHIEDLCRQLVEVSFSPHSNGEIYNIGGETYSLKSAAEIIAHKYHVSTISIPWTEKDLKIESGHTYFDDSKIQKITGSCRYKKIENLGNDI